MRLAFINIVGLSKSLTARNLLFAGGS